MLPAPLRPHMHPQLARAAETLVAAHVVRKEQIPDVLEALVSLLERRRDADSGLKIESERCSGSKIRHEDRGGTGGVAAQIGTGQASTRAEPVLNFLAAELAAIYGRDGASRFCRALLEPARWRNLRRNCFRDDPTQ